MDAGFKSGIDEFLALRRTALSRVEEGWFFCARQWNVATFEFILSSALGPKPLLRTVMLVFESMVSTELQVAVWADHGQIIKLTATFELAPGTDVVHVAAFVHGVRDQFARRYRR